MAGNTVIQAVPVPLSQLAGLIPVQNLNVGTMQITPTDTGVPNTVNAEFANRLNKAGGALSGPVTLADGTPSSSLNPASKQYTDASLTGMVPKSAVSSAMTTATGGTTSRSLADRHGDHLNVKDFGAKGDGTTDDSAAFQATVNAVAAKGGGLVRVPPGNYAIAHTIAITTSNIRIVGEGGGNWYNIGPTFTPGATNLIWTGANGGTMISIITPAAGSSQRIGGCEISSLALIAGAWPFTSAAAIGLDIASCAFSKFDLTTMEFSGTHVNFRVVAGIGETSNNEGNEIRIVFRALSNAGTIMVFGGTNSVGNTTMNHVSYIGGEYLNGTVIDFASCDNNRISFVDGFKANGGTGTLFIFRGQRSIGGEFARQNVVYWVTEQTGGGKIVVEGTDTAGVVGGSIQNQIIFFDYGDDVPNIITGTGSNFWCGSNIQPIGKIYEDFSLGNSSGASVSNSRIGDVWGLATATGAGTKTISVVAHGNSPVVGVQNVQITPLQPGAPFYCSNFTKTSFDLIVEGSGSFFWRAIVI
jgi:hypothetical protein